MEHSLTFDLSREYSVIREYFSDGSIVERPLTVEEDLELKAAMIKVMDSILLYGS